MDGHSGMHMDMPMPTEPFHWSSALALHLDATWLAICVAGVAVYVVGYVRLLRRGDRWPVVRLINWVVGWLTIFLVTGTQVGFYGMSLFSVHMVQHMTMGMCSPIFLLMGAPVTLALRALPPSRVRGRKGPREWLVRLLHTRYVAVVSSPLVTIPLFIASLYGIYFTPIFDFLMGSSLGHFFMLAHFVAVGLLFFWPIMGVDPGPRRSGHLMRIIELFLGMPFHAFFAIAVMMSTTPLLGTFVHPPASLHVSVMTDQQLAGGIAWAFSEVPSVIVLLALVRQWFKSEERISRRKDRAADRGGDAELEAYNAYLARLNAGPGVGTATQQR